MGACRWNAVCRSWGMTSSAGPRDRLASFLMTKALAMARDKEELIHCQRPKKLLGFFGQSNASVELAADDRFVVTFGYGTDP